MATLRKHGKELARIEFARFTKVFCADGKILKNRGDGWKISATVKPGFNPVDVAATAVRRNQEKLDACPNWARFIKLVTRWGVRTRCMLVTAIEMMPEDPDGVWSTMDDHGKHFDLEDIVELCKAFCAGDPELQAFMQARRIEKAKQP